MDLTYWTIQLDADNFAAIVELDEEKKSYPYEHISKLYQKAWVNLEQQPE